MGRPASDLQDYLEWQHRLKGFESSDLDLNVFCLQEGVSRSTFYRWKHRLQDGAPEWIEAAEAEGEPAESNGATFLPISMNGTSKNDGFGTADELVAVDHGTPF